MLQFLIDKQDYYVVIRLRGMQTEQLQSNANNRKILKLEKGIHR